jgi:predicted nucleic acid-binding Zn ribbon protein
MTSLRDRRANPSIFPDVSFCAACDTAIPCVPTEGVIFCSRKCQKTFHTRYQEIRQEFQSTTQLVNVALADAVADQMKKEGYWKHPAKIRPYQFKEEKGN